MKEKDCPLLMLWGPNSEARNEHIEFHHTVAPVGGRITPRASGSRTNVSRQLISLLSRGPLCLVDIWCGRPHVPEHTARRRSEGAEMSGLVWMFLVCVFCSSGLNQFTECKD